MATRTPLNPNKLDLADLSPEEQQLLIAESQKYLEEDENTQAQEQAAQVASQLSSWDALAKSNKLSPQTRAALVNPALQEQRRGLESYMNLAEVAGSAPAQVDYAPLMALVDSWSGTKTSQAYRRPESMDEKRAKIMAYADEVQKRREKLTGSLADLIKSEKAGSSLAERMAQIQGRQQVLASRDAFTRYTSDPTVKQATEALLYAQNAKSTLLSGSKVGMQAFQQMLARAAGEKGPLSNQDVARYQGDPSLMAKMDRALTKYTEGTLTEADQEDMLLLIQAMEDRQREVLANRTEHWAKNVAPHLGVPEETFRKMAQPAYEVGQTGKAVPAPKPAAAPQTVRVSNGKEELEIPITDLPAAEAEGFKRVQ